ncbi:MAG: hypothetical protein LBM98_02950 [Oscillospiraceae bacterium]|nr:hypothetical protein [Oscillospiraceae bacterium]
MRYVERYRCEAIQCRGDNIRMLRARHWIASPLYFLRIASVPVLRNDGQGVALAPAPHVLPPRHAPSPRPTSCPRALSHVLPTYLAR